MKQKDVLVVVVLILAGLFIANQQGWLGFWTVSPLTGVSGSCTQLPTTYANNYCLVSGSGSPFICGKQVGATNCQIYQGTTSDDLKLVSTVGKGASIPIPAGKCTAIIEWQCGGTTTTTTTTSTPAASSYTAVDCSQSTVGDSKCSGNTVQYCQLTTTRSATDWSSFPSSSLPCANINDAGAYRCSAGRYSIEQCTRNNFLGFEWFTWKDKTFCQSPKTCSDLPQYGLGCWSPADLATTYGYVDVFNCGNSCIQNSNTQAICTGSQTSVISTTPSSTTTTCQPPSTGGIYCKDTSTICAWNSQTCKYDCEACIAPETQCTNNKCVTPTTATGTCTSPLTCAKYQAGLPCTNPTVDVAVSDNCGNTLQCKTCAQGPASSSSSPTPCVDTTCAAAGKNCGYIPSNCPDGNQVYCGPTDATHVCLANTLTQIDTSLAASNAAGGSAGTGTQCGAGTLYNATSGLCVATPGATAPVDVTVYIVLIALVLIALYLYGTRKK